MGHRTAGHRIGDIAAALGARVAGDPDVVVLRAAEPAQAGPDDLALAMHAKYGEGLAQGRARAAILWEGADWRALGLAAALWVPRPRVAMAGLTRMLDPGPQIAPGRHAMSVIDPEAQVAADADIGPFVSIGAGAVIGHGARIASHVSIGPGARIGCDALILQGVRIGAGVTIGDRVILQPCSVIGSDGFSFVTQAH